LDLFTRRFIYTIFTAAAAAAEFICHEKNIHVYINVKDRRAGCQKGIIHRATHDNSTNDNDNITNKGQNIEHRSIKAQTQKYCIKKEQNRTHEKTQKSAQPCSIMYNENTTSKVFN